MLIAQVLLLVVGLYAATGLLFAGVFVTIGVGRFDHAAGGAPWGFRLLIVPGVAALWPALAVMWVRRSRETSTPEAHG